MSIQQVWETTGIQCTRGVSMGNDQKAMHIHMVYEIYMPQNPGVKCFVNDRIYELEPGDVMLFTDEDLHKAGVPADVRYDRYVITFPPQLLRGTPCEELLQCFDGQGGVRQPRLHLDAAQREAFITLIEELRTETEGGIPVPAGQWLALCRLLLFLCRLRQQSPSPPAAEKQALHPQIRKVLAYIDDNFRQPIPLETLSELCFLDRHYLCRLFKRQTGFCIHDYITYRRLACAAALLREGKSVSEAAGLSGFGSDTFFITTFKKNVGVTPYRYACRCRPETADTP